jgi:hypothetical protein
MELNVHARNKEARACYKALGFAELRELSVVVGQARYVAVECRRAIR